MVMGGSGQSLSAIDESIFQREKRISFTAF
jgi:hypothetical protein